MMISRLALITCTLIGSAASMKASSALGSKLLSKARKTEEGEVDYSWVMDYSIKFEKCHTVTQSGADEDGVQTMYRENTVEFKLCPTDQCMYGCEGGDYLVDMASFVDLYTEARMTAQELECEEIRENCDCDDVDDEDGCQAQCYTNAGLDYCVEGDDDGAAEFNLQEYLECIEIENQYGDAVEGENYYVGMKCSENGEEVNLKVYTNALCTVEGSDAIYASFMGETLPYADGTNIVAENCVSCSEADGNDDAAAYALTEFCGTSYTSAAKCENDMSISDPILDGCDYIQNLYLREDNYKPRGSMWPLVGMWIFFITTIIFAAVAGRMHMMRSTKIQLNSADGAVV